MAKKKPTTIDDDELTDAERAEQREAQQAERKAQEVRLFQRFRAMEVERRSIAEAIGELRTEASEAGFDPAIIALAVKRDLETAEQRELRTTRDEGATQLLLSI